VLSSEWYLGTALAAFDSVEVFYRGLIRPPTIRANERLAVLNVLLRGVFEDLSQTDGNLKRGAIDRAIQIELHNCGVPIFGAVNQSHHPLFASFR
jgi:hypothetical protein